MLTNARYLVLFLTLCVSPSFAASQMEVRKAVKDKFELTKRSLTGDIRRAGTIIYLTIPGITAERPVMAVKTLTIEKGEVAHNELSNDPSRVALSVGEPMHIYGIQVKKNAVRFHLGTETKYPTRFMGSSVNSHLQTALEFRIAESSEIATILQNISTALLTEEEAAQQPELMAAAMEIRTRNTASPEEQRQATSGVVGGQVQSSATPANDPSSTSAATRTSTQTLAAQPTQAAPQKTQAELRMEELQRLADEKYAKKWDAQLSSSDPWDNPADLLKYSPARTMAALAQGHRIHLTVREISFSSGSMIVEGLHRYTDIYDGIKEQVERELGRSRGDYWTNYFNTIQAATKDRYVSFICKVDPSDAAELTTEAQYIVNATLEDYGDSEYSAPRAILTCSDIVPVP